MMEEKNTQQLSRRALRQHVFRLIYSLGFYQDDAFDEMAERYLESEEIAEENDREMIRRKALAVMQERAQLDAMIDEKSAHWKSSRIAKVDLAIIRLALYEMIYDDEVPVGVAINEAVRIARKYSSDQAPAFVNGVLAVFAPKETEES